MPSHLPVNARHAPPLDARDVRIRLESQGVSNAVAAERGYAGVRAMAEAQFADSWYEPIPRPEPALAKPWFAEYMRGIAFALPLALSGLAMLVLRFSLWGGNLPPDVGAALAVGTVASFIVSGGFVQAMARRGVFFMGTKEPRVCFESTLDWLGLGALALALTACLGLSLNAYFNWLEIDIALMATAFLLGLGVFWLATGILYMLDRSVEVMIAMAMGLALVVILYRGLHVPLMLAQSIGVVVAALAAIGWGVRRLLTSVNSSHNPTGKEPLTRKLLSVAPYFMYGIVLYSFLFADRMTAWTAQAGQSGLVFRSDYEAAVNVALFSFVLQVGCVRVFGTAYRHLIDYGPAAIRASQIVEFNESALRFYRDCLKKFTLVALISTLVVYLGAWRLGVFGKPGIQYVALWALAACPLLVWSLWNVNLLFSLSRPWAVLGAFAVALPVNLAAGYLLSRLASYHSSAVGYALGSVVLFVLSTRTATRTLERCDFHNFTSGA